MPVNVLLARLTDLFVRVSVESCNTIVPPASGKNIDLSAVGSVTLKLVSKVSSVAPSNIR